MFSRSTQGADTTAHKWFHQQSRCDGVRRNSNVFYDGVNIYSYGLHFKMAQLLPKKKVVLLNVETFSLSTTIHQLSVSSAIDKSTHKVIPYVFGRDLGGVSSINIGHYLGEFKRLLGKLAKATKPELYTSQIETLRDELTKAAKYLRCIGDVKKTKEGRDLLGWITPPELILASKERAAKATKRKEAKIAEDVKKWCNFELLSATQSMRSSGLTYLRIIGDTVQSSLGMSTPLVDAIRVYKAWQGGEAVGQELISKGGTYTCAKANGTISFGCHVITKEHAQALFSKL